LASVFPSVIIGDFNFVSVPVPPDEANSKLIVDADAVLTGPLSAERFHVIARKREIPQAGGPVDLVQFAARGPLDGLKSLRELVMEQPLDFGVPKRTNHEFSV